MAIPGATVGSGALATPGGAQGPVGSQGPPGSSGSGSGDMTRAVYDINNNGVVDTCDSLAWSKLTGVPAIGTGDMTKAVYDTNNNGVVDTADSIPWGSVTGKPTTFGIPEAPTDGKIYGRQGNNTSWQPVLPITGGTLTGALTLAADPTVALGAATKQYVDNKIFVAEVGSIKVWPTATPPASWAIMDGSAVSRTLYPDLFALIGTTFGAGDGSTTFNLPDARGRFILSTGQSNANGNTLHNLGDKAGEETHQIVIAELASHTHAQNPHGHTVGVAMLAATGAAVYTPQTYPSSGGYATQSVTATNLNTGSDTPHNTMPPFLCMVWIIKVSQGGGATAQAPIADSTQAGLVNKLDGKSTSYIGGDNACHPLGAPLSFLTAAYNLILGDNNKYLVCSGGSWVLGLPAPVVGLNYRVRNDQGITGTTGTITITPASGTIDGLVSLALLPGQECTLYTDGTNWRSFGRQREVVIGTIDITASTPSQIILLPVGYRLFTLDFTGLTSAADSTVLQTVFSTDGGNTFVTTGYYHTLLFNNSTTTAVASVGANIAYAYLGLFSNSAASSIDIVKIFPGSSTLRPTFVSETSQYYNGGSYIQRAAISGFQTTNMLINALKIGPAAAITSMLITVRGTV